MSLAAKLKSLDRRVEGCAVAQLLAQLDTEDRDALVEALADLVGYSSPQLLDVLRAEGYKVGVSTLKQHRANRCSCER